MIVLTGATGKLGSLVLKYLLKLTPASNIRVSLHNLSKKQDIEALGVEVVQATYDDKESMVKAFSGADKVFLVSSPSFGIEYRVQSHTRAIEAAIEAGVSRVYYTSLALKDGTRAPVMQAHLQTEAYLRSQNKIKYTIIREGLYTEAYPIWMGFFKMGDKEVILPGDGPMTWASREDLGEATAKILADDTFDRDFYYLTNEESFTLEDTAKLIGEILKQDVTFRLVSVDEFKQVHVHEPQYANHWTPVYESLAKGDCDIRDPTLGQVLGRAPRAHKEVLQQLAADKDSQNEGERWLKGGKSQ
ncbi:hypothetical protein BZG36_02397 [Bifiguratus adelaidae]|uniref:NmrA-like domain-containing protein n=1 Tax=Bifiguratus adelaidae TaxID=1938954 RepID=A0A261Y1M0_9FUNG|nr:hypothetical protein BZG36_02397 [Bifiguratus adelaidae]